MQESCFHLSNPSENQQIRDTSLAVFPLGIDLQTSRVADVARSHPVLFTSLWAGHLRGGLRNHGSKYHIMGQHIGMTPSVTSYIYIYTHTVYIVYIILYSIYIYNMLILFIRMIIYIYINLIDVNYIYKYIYHIYIYMIHVCFPIYIQWSWF